MPVPLAPGQASDSVLAAAAFLFGPAYDFADSSCAVCVGAMTGYEGWGGRRMICRVACGNACMQSITQMRHASLRGTGGRIKCESCII